ncbi:MAG TPA: EF-hand domain-containing protein [Isosphaeraceae bacterium]|jgi:hypothetical protein|nr:EF-hand domain-containing protein [Isosphaeraceae bacterium]
MRKPTMLILACGLLAAATLAAAQRPGEADDLVTRMMAFDKDKDGKLTKAEVTDDRLHRLFDRADADKDGTVTKAELTALAAKERATLRNGPGGPGGRGGPGGFGMGPPRPGVILPPPVRQALNLSSEQVKQLDELQKEVDAKLDKILTDDQKTQLQDMRRRGPGGPPGGPGGFGPPGGPGGRRGGGRPPGGDGPPPDRPE